MLRCLSKRGLETYHIVGVIFIDFRDIIINQGFQSIALAIDDKLAVALQT